MTRVASPAPGGRAPLGTLAVRLGEVLAGESIVAAFRRQLASRTGRRTHRMWKLRAITTFFDEDYEAVLLAPGAVAEVSTPEQLVLDESLHCEYRWCGQDGAGRSAGITVQLGGEPTSEPGPAIRFSRLRCRPVP